MPEPITLIVPYYEQPKMLNERLKHWGQVNAKHAEWRVCLIDDGSTGTPAREVVAQRGANIPGLTLLEIKDDIPWNDGGAKNLGMQQCETEWAITTDLDHVLPLDSWGILLSVILHPQRHYSISRFDTYGYPLVPHAATFIVTRECFWEAGGFDEDFSGIRGGDTEFRGLLERTCPSKYLSDVWCVCWEDFEDATVSERSIEDDREKRMTINRQKAENNNAYPVHPIRFEWGQVI